ncbi:hypothetical protein QTP70_004904 [Hemibagrus guttatus]|uniref:Gypsy retrotransposon integrase-like protein 1 n=1 Tax=Hemibagrus guttatus TaxID=175788 RepID=A0AAE0UWQ9_9TELE|nr:hypothetical protein QTP70_004904 [Hemibagrus guttatus]
MKVLVIHNSMAEDDLVDMTIVIEGIQVISGCGYKTKACMLIGLINALNLETSSSVPTDIRMDPSPRASDLETRYSYIPTTGKSIHVSTPVLTKPTTDEEWKAKYAPEVTLRNISEATEAPDSLRLVAANGANMPYSGWVELTFKLASPVTEEKELTIPVLVLKDQELPRPIIGTVRSAFPSIKKKSVHTFINLVTAEDLSEYVVLPETTEGDGNTDRWDPPVDVNHLTPPQQQQVKQMLREECHAFSKSDDDIGCVPEMKDYLHDLIAQGDLNNKTIPDRQPIPRVQDILDGLGGNAWFSLLDQGKAYHQAFQRFMEESLEGLRDKICIPYLDDILVFTESFEEQVEAVKKVLQRIVSAEGSRIDPADTVAVTALKEQTPSTVGELRKILGLLSYYRQYIKDFSRIASPLYDLLKSNTEDAGPQRKRKNKIRNNKRNHVVPSNFSQPFILHTDASNQGLGAVLYQQQNGKLRVIAYGSRTLTAAEKNYHLHSGKLEFLALKWAITEKFRDYLYYAPTFTVFSDNNPLTYVLTSAKLNATGCRWVSELADFHFTIRYRPVEFQGNPDVTLAVACQSVLATGSRPRQQWRSVNSPAKVLLREWEKLKLDDHGVLFRQTSQRKQLVLPTQLKRTVLREMHDEMGHQGLDRTTSLIRDRFFWPYMQKDIENYVLRTCCCIKQKKPCRETRAPLKNIKTTHPFELVSIDFLHLDKCKGGYEYILVIVDHFTRFAQAYATTSKSAKTVADRLFNDFALKFGFPSRIHHDQGGEFENQLLTQLKKYSGVAGSRTTPYHPQGNGQVERFNRTLLQMLKTLTDRQKANWKDALNKLIFAYNCTRCDVTGFSPFQLLFGRSPKLPIDALFGLNSDNNSQSYSEYMERWTKGMQEA